MNILIHKNGQQVGPFSEAQIPEMLKSGMLAASDQAWTDGMETWKPLAEWSEFFSGSSVPPPVPPPVPVGAPPPASKLLPTVNSGVSFGRDPNMVYPPNPPRSIGWMTFWGFIWPGLGQALCGQGAKGATLMITSSILYLALAATIILPLAICVAGAIDAHKVAKRLASGKPVKKWELFPN